MTPATAETPNEIKARGAFYTPPELTRFLSSWAVRSADDRVLEPSCGDGAFVTALSERFTELGRHELADHLVGVERDQSEAAKAAGLAPGADIRSIDFFDLDLASLRAVNAVVGNPPYIRYHGFVGPDREKALARVREQGVQLTRLASSWAHFVIHAAGFLHPAGRLALVLPAELLHTDYGGAVRDFLLRRFSSVRIIAFNRLVFSDAQVDAVLLLASHDDASGLRVIRLEDEHALTLAQVGPLELPVGHGKPSRWSASVDLDAARVYEDALSSRPAVRLGELASVDIGFVSGANHYFVLSRGEARRWRLPSSVLTPAVRRPSDVPGLMVSEAELSLLVTVGSGLEKHAAVKAYLAHGDASGISQRYKPRSRPRWYAVPLPRRRADAFLPYMFHHGPRLIVNRVGARSTNLLHGVALSSDSPPVDALSVAMTSSLTLLSAEIEGRAYGGGVLKLETREAERLLVPHLDYETAASLAEMLPEADALVRAGAVRQAARNADSILGLDHDALWAAYSVFRDRRLGRGRSRRLRGKHPSAVAAH